VLNHYLPRYYLKGFTESPTSELIWVYEKNCDRVFRTSVGNVACEHGFYCEMDEKYLANVIEGPANPVIAKIREKQEISPEDKEDSGDSAPISAPFLGFLHRDARTTATSAP
jgi:hypothetical protein